MGAFRQRIAWARFRNTHIALTVAAVVILVSVWVWPQLPVEDVDEVTPQALYLLSALVQALATTLALVFTISLVIAQLAARYVYRTMSELFDIVALAYVALFLAAVILASWALSAPTVALTRLSFSVGAFAFVALVPYFLRFRSHLDVHSLIDQLSDEVARSPAAELSQPPASIHTLVNVATSASKAADLLTAEHAMQAIGKCAWEVLLQDPTETDGTVLLDETLPVYAQILDDLVLIAVEEHTRGAFTTIRERLHNMSLEMLSRSWQPSYLVDDLHTLGREAIRRRWAHDACLVCHDLESIADRALVGDERRTLRSTVSAVSSLISAAARSEMPEATQNCLESFSSLIVRLSGALMAETPSVSDQDRRRARLYVTRELSDVVYELMSSGYRGVYAWVHAIIDQAELLDSEDLFNWLPPWLSPQNDFVDEDGDDSWRLP